MAKEECEGPVELKDDISDNEEAEDSKNIEVILRCNSSKGKDYSAKVLSTQLQYHSCIC